MGLNIPQRCIIQLPPGQRRLQGIGAAIRWHAVAGDQLAPFQLVDNHHQIGPLNRQRIGQLRLAQAGIVHDQYQSGKGDHPQIMGFERAGQIGLHDIERTFQVIAQQTAQGLVADLSHLAGGFRIWHGLAHPVTRILDCAFAKRPEAPRPHPDWFA